MECVVSCNRRIVLALFPSVSIIRIIRDIRVEFSWESSTCMCLNKNEMFYTISFKLCQQKKKQYPVKFKWGKHRHPQTELQIILTQP